MRALTLVAVAALGCAHPAPCTHPSAFAMCEDGTECRQNADCASLRCVSGTCVASCESAASCADGQVCLRGATGSSPRECTSTCPSAFAYHGAHEGLVCALGHVVHCADVSDADGYCDGCGCSAGNHCFMDTSAGVCSGAGTCHCGPLGSTGEPCSANADCASGNCDPSRGCQLAAGAPCVVGAGDCTHCDPTNGAHACRQLCAMDFVCSMGTCAQRGTNDVPACYVDCTADASVCDASEHCSPIADDPAMRAVCVPR